MPTIPELLRDHVSLDLECVDRVYLNGYTPTLQKSGALVYFLERHRRHVVASPVLLGEMTREFVAQVEAYAQTNHIRVVRFLAGQRKDDLAACYRQKFKARQGVVFLGVAQEKLNGFKPHNQVQGRRVSFQFSRESVFVKVYYFYLQEADFGPGFIKIRTYAPYPAKVCVNEHAWAEQQLRRAGVGFEALGNGFLGCADAARLQAV